MAHRRLGRVPLTSAPPLAFSTQDPERRLGLPAGRFTCPNHFLALIGGLAIAVFLYAVLYWLRKSVVSQSLIDRGPIPYFTVAFSCWALVILFFKYLKLSFQRRALGLELIPKDPSFVLSIATVDHVQERMHELVDAPERFVLFNRIRIALANFRNMRRVGDVREVLDAQADNDEGVAESSYSVLRALIWAIPVLGFIGTVLGLSAAIGKFASVLESAGEIEKLKPALQQVTGGLGVAFETTLQALLGALAIHLILTVVKASEERFLDDTREYCQKFIVGRLRISAAEEE